MKRYGLHLLLLVTLAAQPVLADWTIVDAGINATINSVSYPSADEAWLCDASGGIWYTGNGGQTWDEQINFGLETMRGISFADNQYGTTVAYSGSIYKTNDGGDSWTTVQDGFLISWYDVYTIPGTQASYCAGQNTIFAPLVMYTTDGWATDDAFTFYIDIGGSFNEGSIRCFHAIDTSTLIAGCRLFDGTGAICRSTDGGDTWATVWHDMSPVFDLAFLDANVGVAAVGDGSIMRTTDGGVTWTTVMVAAGSPMQGVAFQDADNVWAVGGGGSMYSSNDGGVTWVEEDSGTNMSLWSIDFANATSGIAVGANGTILVYDSGGAPAMLDLIAINSELPSNGGTIYYDVSFESTYPNTVNGLRFWVLVDAPNEQTYLTLSQYFTHTPFMDVYMSAMEQPVPSFAPGGTYTLTGHIGFYPNPLLMDGFEFFKDDGGSADGVVFDPPTWQSRSEFAVAENSASSTAPTEFSLSEAFPNPFNPTASVSVSLPQASQLKVQVFDVTGRLVTTLAPGGYTAGTHAFTIDGTNMASGLYFVRVDAGSFGQQTRKVTLMK
ncbi:T9SS type A sorting domain-containing protein [bacterium]|nr:T9SS type A sorting domain-containing protein [bacterium]